MWANAQRGLEGAERLAPLGGAGEGVAAGVFVARDVERIGGACRARQAEHQRYHEREQEQWSRALRHRGALVGGDANGLSVTRPLGPRDGAGTALGVGVATAGMIEG